MVLGLIVGDVGSGKTVMLTKIAETYSRHGFPVYANYGIKLPNYHRLEPEKLLSIENRNGRIFIGLDEGWSELESRTSGKASNRYYSYILNQSRKRGFDFYVTTQDESEIDKRFKYLANYRILCEKYEDRECFVYWIEKRSIKGNRIKKFILPFREAEKIYPLYDTLEIINSNNMKNLALDIIMNDADKLMKMVNEATEKIYPQLARFTKGAVEVELIKHGYPSRIAKYVYEQIRTKKSEKYNSLCDRL